MTAPMPAPNPGPFRPGSLPFGPPFLIADPAAARRDLTLLRRALAAAGVVAEAAVARPVERAGQLAAQALADGHRLLVAVGSDRLAHALLRVLVDPGGPRWPEAVLGLAGLGRQDLSATFGLPDEPAKLARHLLGPNLFLADVGRARWRGPDGTERVSVFANTAELGYPAEVSARAPGGPADDAQANLGMASRWAGRARPGGRRRDPTRGRWRWRWNPPQRCWNPARWSVCASWSAGTTPSWAS